MALLLSLLSIAIIIAFSMNIAVLDLKVNFSLVSFYSAAYRGPIQMSAYLMTREMCLVNSGTQRLGVRNWIALFQMKLRELLPFPSLSFLFYFFRFQNETTEELELPENSGGPEIVIWLKKCKISAFCHSTQFANDLSSDALWSLVTFFWLFLYWPVGWMDVTFSITVKSRFFALF